MNQLEDYQNQLRHTANPKVRKALESAINNIKTQQSPTTNTAQPTQNTTHYSTPKPQSTSTSYQMTPDEMSQFKAIQSTGNSQAMNAYLQNLARAHQQQNQQSTPSPTSGLDSGTANLLSELGRTQKAYDEYVAAGRKDLADNAAAYGQQLRQQAQQKGIDLTQYGTKNQYGYDYEKYYTDNGSNAGVYDTSQQGEVIAQQVTQQVTQDAQQNGQPLIQNGSMSDIMDYINQQMGKIDNQYELSQIQRDQAKAAMLLQLRQQADAQFEQTKSALDKQKAEQLNALTKQYADATGDANQSIADAKTQFQQQGEQINQANYQASEARNLSASQRGIGNSQQLLGMQATDQQNAINLNNQNVTQRDQRINALKDRINQLAQQKTADINELNSQYTADVNAAQANADQAVAQGSFNLNAQDFENQQQMDFQKMMQDRQNLQGMQNMLIGNQLDLNKMDIAHQYNQQDAQTAQEYQQQNLALQNKLQLEQMAKANGYDLNKMSVQQKYAFDQMAQQFGYDKEKMQIEQQYGLDVMAKQFDYDMSRMTQSNKFQQSLQKMAQENKLALFDKESQAKIEAANAEYKQAVARELAQYTPGTSEYNIKQKQLQEQRDNTLQAAVDDFRNKAIVQSTISNPYLDMSGSIDMPKPNMFGQVSQSSIDTYNKKRQAIINFNNLMGGNGKPGTLPVPPVYKETSGNHSTSTGDGSVIPDWAKKFYGG